MNTTTTKYILGVIFLFSKNKYWTLEDGDLKPPRERGFKTSSSPHWGGTRNLKVSSSFFKILKRNTWKRDLKSFKFHSPSSCQTPPKFLSQAYRWATTILTNPQWKSLQSLAVANNPNGKCWPSASLVGLPLRVSPLLPWILLAPSSPPSLSSDIHCDNIPNFPFASGCCQPSLSFGSLTCFPIRRDQLELPYNCLLKVLQFIFLLDLYWRQSTLLTISFTSILVILMHFLFPKWAEGAC